MNFFRVFSKDHEGTWTVIIAAAAVAGLMQGMIVVNLNGAASSIAEGGLNARYFLLFFMSVLGYAVAAYYASTKTVALSSSLIIDLYVRIAHKVSKAGLRSFENIGKAEIYNKLSTNSDIIMEGAKCFPIVGSGIVMITFSALYIAIISLTALLAVIGFYIFGIFIYLNILRQINSKIKQSSIQESTLKGLFRNLIEGYKEIKIDRKKGQDLLDNDIQEKSKLAKDAKIDMERNLVNANVFIQSFFYMLIAFMIFLLPQISALQPIQIVMIAAIVLFSYGPMTRIFMSAPLIMKAETAVNGIEELEALLDNADDTKEFSDSGMLRRQTDTVKVELNEVVFTYSSHRKTFSLGPISLRAKTGEIVFIVGENGSGKSTLLKLIAGLYYPKTGQLRVNDIQVEPNNYPHYRDKLSVIFTDFYLFDRFYGKQAVEENEVLDLLVKMGLDGKTDWVNHKFMHLDRLSAGERKRLALLFSGIDDKQVLVFDEIAADLDPHFRKFFYEDYLPELSAQGKLIIASCHDEKYFDVANQVVRLQTGKMVTDSDTATK